MAVLDEESLLATATYIDLNPVAAGLAPTPESSEHTSLHERIEHCLRNGTLATIRDDLSCMTSDPAQEADLWLLPLEEMRARGSSRAGMVEGCTFSCYLRGLIGPHRHRPFWEQLKSISNLWGDSFRPVGDPPTFGDARGQWP